METTSTNTVKTRDEKMEHVAEIIMRLDDHETELATLVAQSMQTGYTLGRIAEKTA